MKILIIGGSRFMGYYATQHARARGHEVTLFNRGKTNPDTIPGVEQLVGDRDADIDLLKDRQWDSVLDTCGYFPRVVKKSVDLLKDDVGHYTFISSISVYSTSPNGPDETSPAQTLADPTVEEITGETYGGLKILCERVVQEGLPDHALIVRPGLIVGPRDPTYRFNYWVNRIARGGETLVPATPDRPIQFIDARDVGEWIVRQMEAQAIGTFNATGPAKPLTMGAFVEACQKHIGSDSRFRWVNEAFLGEQNVAMWEHIPLCMPEEDRYFNSARIDRALQAGLTFRAFGETLDGARAWMADHPEAANPQATLTAEKEKTVLEAWHAASAT